MKRLFIAAALATLVLGSSPSAATAEADVRVEGGSAEVTNWRAIGCDEAIRLSGTVRWVTTFVSIPTDRQLRIVRFVEANLTGVGETSGTTYRLVSIIGSTFMVDSEDSTVITTYEVTYKIFGGGRTYTLKGLLHTTIVPNGLKVSFSDLTEDGCSP